MISDYQQVGYIQTSQWHGFGPPGPLDVGHHGENHWLENDGFLGHPMNREHNKHKAPQPKFLEKVLM